MIKEPIEKFHCYGNDDVYNMTFCKEEKCRFLTACAVWAGHHVVCKQWEFIDKIHHNMTVAEIMETLQIRLTQGLIDEISKLVDRGIYPSNSECVRDAVRRLITGSGKMEVPDFTK